MEIQYNTLYEIYNEYEKSFMEYMESKFEKTDINPAEKPIKKVYESFYTWIVHHLKKNKKEHIIPTGYTRSSMSKMQYIEAILKILDKKLSEKSINNIDRVRSVAQTERKQNEVNDYEKKLEQQKKDNGDLRRELEQQKNDNGDLRRDLEQQKKDNGDLRRDLEQQKKDNGDLRISHNKNEQLITQHKKHMKAFKNCDNEVKRFSMELEEQKKENKNLRLSLETTKREYGNKIANLKKYKREYNECFKDLEKQKKSINMFHNNVKSKMNELEQEKNDYAKRLEETKSENIRLKEHKMDNSQLDKKKKEYEDCSRQLKEKNQVADKLKKKLSTLQQLVHNKPPDEVEEKMYVLNNEEMAKIRKASEAPGIVRSVVRVRCTDEESDKRKLSFTDKTINNVTFSVIKSVYENNDKEPINIKQPIENLVIYNDQIAVTKNENMECSNDEDIKKRNDIFIERALPGISNFDDVDQKEINLYKDYTIIAYGQSGSGKTTSINNLFEYIKKSIVKPYIEDFKANHIGVSFVDIYKDEVTYLHDEVNKVSNRLFELKKRRKTFDEYTEKLLITNSQYKKLRNYKDLINYVNDKYKFDYTTEEYLESTKINHERKIHSNRKSRFSELQFEEGNYNNFCDKYDEMKRKVSLVRPTTKTPENISGSSRSHLVTRIMLKKGDSIQYINLVDLAGGEDYSNATQTQYNDKLLKSNCMDMQLMKSIGGQYFDLLYVNYITHVNKESEWITKSLKDFMELIENVNEREGVKSNSKADENISELMKKSELVRTLVDDVKIASDGTVNTLLVTFKSDTESETLKLAQDTLEKLKKILPKQYE